MYQALNGKLIRVGGMFKLSDACRETRLLCLFNKTTKTRIMSSLHVSATSYQVGSHKYETWVWYMKLTSCRRRDLLSMAWTYEPNSEWSDSMTLLALMQLSRALVPLSNADANSAARMALSLSYQRRAIGCVFSSVCVYIYLAAHRPIRWSNGKAITLLTKRLHSWNKFQIRHGTRVCPEMPCECNTGVYYNIST